MVSPVQTVVEPVIFPGAAGAAGLTTIVYVAVATLHGLLVTVMVRVTVFPASPAAEV